jgi:hypothetical protein
MIWNTIPDDFDKKQNIKSDTGKIETQNIKSDTGKIETR